MQKIPTKNKCKNPPQKNNGKNLNKKLMYNWKMRERVNRYPLRKHELSERKRVRYQNEGNELGIRGKDIVVKIKKNRK